MADPQRSVDFDLRDELLQIIELAFRTDDHGRAAVRDGNAGGIVTAIFEMAKAAEEDGRRFTRANVANDTAHFRIPFQSDVGLTKV
jgi:hypothetical protein